MGLRTTATGQGSPIPHTNREPVMNTCEHLKITKNGNTKLLVTFTIGQRQGLARISELTNTSQQALIRGGPAAHRRAPRREAQTGRRPKSAPK